MDKLKYSIKALVKSKTVKTFLLNITAVSFCMAAPNLIRNDTVIIELDNSSKIFIITKSQSELASLEEYDINQMIRDLNDQLSDSVEYLEIDGGKVYVNEENVEMKDWEVNNDKVNIKLGGLEIDVDTDEIDDWDDDWEKSKKVTHLSDPPKGTTHHFNLDLGINNWMEGGQFPDGDNAPYTVKPFGSWYVALKSINRTWIRDPLLLDWGIGVSWYNWKMQDADVQISEKPEMIEFNLAVDPISGIKSKLTASYINVHMIPMFDLSRGRKKVTSYRSSGLKIKRYTKTGFRFGAGVYAGYRIASHAKFRFKNNGSSKKNKESDNFFLENFRYGVRGQVGWKGVELFVMYDLNEVFASGRGPINADGQNAKLNAITFGITL